MRTLGTVLDYSVALVHLICSIRIFLKTLFVLRTLKKKISVDVFNISFIPCCLCCEAVWSK